MKTKNRELNLASDSELDSSVCDLAKKLGFRITKIHNKIYFEDDDCGLLTPDLFMAITNYTILRQEKRREGLKNGTF